MHNRCTIDKTLACQNIGYFHTTRFYFVSDSRCAQIVLDVEMSKGVSDFAELIDGFPVSDIFNAAARRLGHHFPDLYGAIRIFFLRHFGDFK